MNRRRVFELVLLTALCAIVAAWIPGWTAKPSETAKPGETGQLRRVVIFDDPFRYQMEVEPNGAKMQASYACVSATPEPGRPSCQHLEDTVPTQQWSEVEAMCLVLVAKHSQQPTSTKSSGGPPSSHLELTYPARTLRCPLTKEDWNTLANQHPGKIRTQLQRQYQSQNTYPQRTK